MSEKKKHCSFVESGVQLYLNSRDSDAVGILRPTTTPNGLWSVLMRSPPKRSHALHQWRHRLQHGKGTLRITYCEGDTRQCRSAGSAHLVPLAAGVPCRPDWDLTDGGDPTPPPRAPPRCVSYSATSRRQSPPKRRRAHSPGRE